MSKANSFILFALVVLIWGANWSIIKLLVETVPPIWSTAIRSGIAALALLILQVSTKQLIMPKLHDLPAIIIVGVFHITIFASLMAIGLQYTTVGRSVILGYTTPLWVTPAAIILLKEPLHKLRLLGVIMGIIGVVVLFAPAIGSISTSTVLLGNAILLAASFSWAITIVSIKIIKWHSTPFQLVFWQTLMATILTSLIALYFEGVPSFEITNSVIWLSAYNGLLATAFGFWAMTVVNRNLPAIVTSLGLLATPITGIAFSQYILGEALDTQLIIAGGFIMLGIALGCISPDTKKESKA